MLKVVGASWEKTRLTTIMLGTVSAIAIFAIFFFEVPVGYEDGNYAATVFWNKQHHFRIEFWGQGNDPDEIKKGVARAYYKPSMKTTGWASLEIETQDKYPDWVQAHSAGLLEGSLCWQVIYWHWQNTIGYICQEKKSYCDQIRQFIRENTQYIKKYASEKDSTDPFWHQVNLFYIQLDGLENGWRYAIERSRKKKEIDISHVDFLWMNSLSDLRDLEMKFNFTKDVQPVGKPLAISLLKLIPNSNKEFVVAHASAGYYNEMLRLQKRYNFSYHLNTTNTSGLIPGRAIEFTSYPGTLHSQDDFYQISGAKPFIVSGAAIKIYNQNLWDEVDQNQPMVGVRVMTANRLAQSAKHWSELMNSFSSGTGNKQWLVIEPNSTMEIWTVEQIPGKSKMLNITDIVHQQGYWPSFGLPFDEELSNLVGYKTAGKDIVDFFKSTEKILREGQVNIVDRGSLVSFMRGPDLTKIGRSDIVGDEPTSSAYHDYLNISNEIDGLLKEVSGKENSRHSKDEGTMENKLLVGNKPLAFYTSPESITEDQNDKLKDIPIVQNPGILHKEMNGNIDLKISSGGPTFTAYAGPPYNNEGQFAIEPFQWSKTLFNDICHQGQPDVWDFEPVETDWVWSQASEVNDIEK
ncbi:hypothetical protein AAG570_000201 [Ranatra chinensis]|uniref:Phospholipase B-like n=1 Tax=Ranatra chinensis TaxID=642074 RepID=A0ABD0YYJ3_9HEMI